MQVYGDGAVIEPGVVRGAQYTYCIESKAILWVQSPSMDGAETASRGLPFFILALSLAGLAGIVLNEQGAVFFLPLMVIAGAALVSLAKSFRRQKAGEWKLLVGAGEATTLIYSTPDAAAFQVKRNEIEQALLGRRTSEDE